MVSGSRVVPLFAHIPDNQLLGYGVPVEWLGAVKAADEDSILDLADHLPAEAAEALLEQAVGKVGGHAKQTWSSPGNQVLRRRVLVGGSGQEDDAG